MAPASSSLWRLVMRRSTLAICALLTVAILGCDQVNTQVNTAKAKLKLAWDKLRGRSTAPAPPPPPVRPAADTAATRATGVGWPQAAPESTRSPAPRQCQAPTRHGPPRRAATSTLATRTCRRGRYRLRA